MANNTRRLAALEIAILGGPADDVDVTQLTDDELEDIIRRGDGPTPDMRGYTDAELDDIVAGKGNPWAT